MKTGDTLRKNVLRLLLGEIETIESSGKKADSTKIIKKLIDSNNQILAIKTDDILIKENEILSAMLPKEISRKELAEFIGSFQNQENNSLYNQIVAAKSEGQGIGLAVKTIKQIGLVYNSNDLIEVIKEMRSVSFLVSLNTLKEVEIKNESK